MNAAQRVADAGQSLWLDNLTRDLLHAGTLARYAREWAVTGLTSNPTIFHQAVSGSTAYDEDIRSGTTAGRTGEALFFDFALADLAAACDLFRPAFDRTGKVDGWCSLEVSPLLAHDTAATVAAARELHARADRPNLYIKIPGTREGLGAIEEAVFAGVPVNVTLLFSREQYLSAAEAWLRGIERRIDAGLSADVSSVASLFVSRWDAAVAGKVPEPLRNRLGLAIGAQVYAAYRALLASPRWQRAMNRGARPQRLLFASTGTKDPDAPKTLYVAGLVAPLTVDTMPEATLRALAEGADRAAVLPTDGHEAERALADVVRAGVDLGTLAAKLQADGEASFVKSWNALLEVIAGKSAALRSR